MDAGAAANEMGRSGATLKAGARSVRGWRTPISAITGTGYSSSPGGLSAAGGIAGAATGGASNIAQTDASAANAQSSIYGNVASSLGGSANQLLSNKNFQSYFAGGAAPQGIAYAAPGLRSPSDPIGATHYGRVHIQPAGFSDPERSYSNRCWRGSSRRSRTSYRCSRSI